VRLPECGFVSDGYVVGYDPGGGGNHGVAVLNVREHANGLWSPTKLIASAEHNLGDAIKWFESRCKNGSILAAGIDTLTEWNAGDAGWRPADQWLKKTYPKLQSSVISPNGLCGAMPLNGAAFLLRLRRRFSRDRTSVTETHPTVCYFACTGKNHDWPDSSRGMTRWLVRQFAPASCRFAAAHEFDACMSALAALRGLNKEWTLDLHNLPPSQLDVLPRCGAPVRLVGRTHYWWPE
jgi:hypothetical protein